MLELVLRVSITVSYLIIVSVQSTPRSDAHVQYTSILLSPKGRLDCRQVKQHEPSHCSAERGMYVHAQSTSTKPRVDPACTDGESLADLWDGGGKR